MEERPLILVTNDDGIRSPGLGAAVGAVADMAEILIAAPHVQQTGMGRAFVRGEETGIIEVWEIEIQGRRMRGYGVHGTPAFAVAHGVLELAERKPDLCISGINYGENMGTDLTCSGTLGAVFEAATYGIPGIAVSLETEIEEQRSEKFREIDFSRAADVLRSWTRRVLAGEMPSEADILNINIPAASGREGAVAGEEWKMTVQSRQSCFEFVRPGKRELRKPFALQTRRCVDVDKLERDGDIYTVYIEKKISVTPLRVNMSVL